MASVASRVAVRRGAVAAAAVAGVPSLAAAASTVAGTRALLRVPDPERLRETVHVGEVAAERMPRHSGDVRVPAQVGDVWTSRLRVALPSQAGVVVGLSRPRDGARLLVGPEAGSGWRWARPLAGAPSAGRWRLDYAVWRGPHEAGLVGGQAQVPCAHGALPPALWAAPRGDDGPWPVWMVIAHGRHSLPRHGLRLARAAAAAGVPSLAVAYRGDPGGFADGAARLGAVEWQEVDAAVAWARQRGARRVVVAGLSMGASVVTSWLRRGEHAAAASALVLDAPVVDWRTTVRAVAVTQRLPASMAAPVMAVAGRRLGVGWDELSLLSDPPRAPLPTLVLHGHDDAVCPVDGSRRLEEALPQAVRVEEFAAGHAGVWNADPARYERLVAGFVAAHRG